MVVRNMYLRLEEGVIVKIPKKGDIVICANNRGITLLSIAGNVFCALVLWRIRDAVHECSERIKLDFERDAPAPISVLPFANL